MFSGIVQAVGDIEKVEPLEAGVRLTVQARKLGLADAKVGDSIAMNGACMTATSIAGDRFTVDVSRESLNVTAGLGAPGPVNLEKSMRVAPEFIRSFGLDIDELVRRIPALFTAAADRSRSAMVVPFR